MPRYRWPNSWGAFSGCSGFCCGASAIAGFLRCCCFSLFVGEVVVLSDDSAVIFLCPCFLMTANCSDLKSRSDPNPMCSYKASACCALLMFQYACCCVCRWRGCGVIAVQVDAGVFIEVHGLADVCRAWFLFVVGELSPCVACGVPVNAGRFPC